jgi:hypothetical protein
LQFGVFTPLRRIFLHKDIEKYVRVLAAYLIRAGLVSEIRLFRGIVEDDE